MSTQVALFFSPVYIHRVGHDMPFDIYWISMHASPVKSAAWQWMRFRACDLGGE